MEERKIANEDGITFAYRDVREGEKSPWKLNGNPVVPVAVPAPNDYQKTDLLHWTNNLTEKDLEFSIQYYYDRWNFSGDSCDEDKRIVDALTEERDKRQEWKKMKVSSGGGISFSGGYVYMSSYAKAGGTATVTISSSGGGAGGAGGIASGAAGGMVNITSGSWKK